MSALCCPAISVAERVATGDPSALEALYHLINQTIRPYVNYRLRDQEAEDLVHETLTIALEQIRNGELRNPGSIGPYLHRIARRQLAALFITRTRRRRMHASAFPSCTAVEDPEVQLLTRERSAFMRQGLDQLQGRDREVLTRFYLDGQPVGRICLEMRLTENQVRLFKSRAKAKLAKWAKAASC